MKTIAIISIILISFTLQSEIIGAGKDFLVGMLSIVEGNDFKLDEACLGNEFEKDVSDFVDALSKRDIILIPAYAGKLFNDITLKCPISDISKIQKDALSLGMLELFNRIQKHRVEVLEMLKKEFIKEKVNVKSIGEVCGHIINIWIYEKPEVYMLNFLADVKSIGVSNVEEFINGFFEGVSAVPVEQNKCINDIKSVKNDIVGIVTKIIDAYNNKNISGIIAAINDLIDLLNKIKGVSSNCNFDDLVKKLTQLSTESGIMSFGWNVIKNLSTTVNDVRTIENGIKVSNYENSGKAMGDLFKVLLKYTTN